MTKAAEDPRGATAPGDPADRSTIACGLAGALALYAAHPPLGLGWLAWLAPAAWLLLVARRRLPGRRPYRILWLVGAVHWGLTIQWLRLPHPANYGAWMFVTCYLACYLPAFVALARLMVHRFGWPLWIAGPVAWTGLESLRARLLTGFLMASLAHTQANCPRVIQIAEFAGEYAVTFLIVLVAAAIAQAIEPLLFSSEPGRLRPRRELLANAFKSLVPAVLALAATLGWGAVKLTSYDAQLEGSDSPTCRVALIQPDMPAIWKGSAERDADVMRQQIELSKDAAEAARSEGRPLDLVVWPETMFRTPLFVDDAANPPPDGAVHPSNYTAALSDLKALAHVTGAAVLVGLDRIVASRNADATTAGSRTSRLALRGHNSAACVDRDGNLLGTYDKMHLLPFGEYVPLVDWIPLLRRVTPVTGQASPGREVAAFLVEGVRCTPNICYETALPHLIRRQCAELAAAGKAPDVLANLTNDAWYWGSSELDMHLASGVFRAVEMRTPLVIAANRGLSAHVDAVGRIVQVTERNKPAFLVCDVAILPREGRKATLYAARGDWLPLGCLICCMLLVAAERVRRRSALRSPA
jgi:apolipoprotein N-acyltransferase